MRKRTYPDILHTVILILLIALASGCGDEFDYHTVIFDSNGGTPLPIQEFVKNNLVTEPPAITRSGYSFGGWYREETFATPWDFAVDTVGSDLTLYAKWTADSYTITYHPNDGTNDPANPDQYTIETLSITLLPPTREHYTFNGWYTNESFTGSPVTTIPTGSSGDKVFWAKWTINQYTVTYHDNGASDGSVPATVTQDYDSTFTVSANTGDLVGAALGGDHAGSGIRQALLGWSTNALASTPEYKAGATFALRENVDLYAIYSTDTSALRKIGPAGGWAFYDAGNYINGWRYMECAPVSTEFTSVLWGGYNTMVSGAVGEAIGTGRQNTTDIVTQFSNAEPYQSRSDYAAKLCDDLVHNGYSDWFLPSKNELFEMCYILHSQGPFGDNPTYGGDRVGTFSVTVEYFSSTQYDAQGASSLQFWNAAAGWVAKFYAEPRVRAVRSF